MPDRAHSGDFLVVRPRALGASGPLICGATCGPGLFGPWAIFCDRPMSGYITMVMVEGRDWRVGLSILAPA